MSDFLGNYLHSFVAYLPLMAGCYISILILRFPDLTIEASWSLGGITACLLCSSMPPIIAAFCGLAAGAVCGALTSSIFHVTGRVKLLSGLISYYILEAVGYHLLGNQAALYLDRGLSNFGFPTSSGLALAFYVVVSLLAFLLVVVWQRSRLGIASRLLGEKPRASIFFKMSLNSYFGLGLVLSNALAGLGGGMWAVYYGQATNLHGIGLVLQAFLALLIGDELLRLTGMVKRAVPAAIVVGTAVFVFLGQSSEFLQLEMARRGFLAFLKPTDKRVVVALVLIGLLWARGRSRAEAGSVSEW